MRTLLLFPALLFSAVLASPASANWFSNPALDINLHIGSARSPTPDQVRNEAQPMLVRDADGNVIAMIDPRSGKIIATAEPAPKAQAASRPANQPATPAR